MCVNCDDITRIKNVKRGQVYYADLHGIEQSLGCEQTGRRPVLIIQNDVGNRFSQTTIVVTLTTKLKKDLPIHVVLGKINNSSNVSVACVGQIKTIDKSRLENYVGSVDEETMQKVDKAIKISLGIENNDSGNFNFSNIRCKAEERVDMNVKPSQTLYDGQNIDWLQMAESQFQFFTYIEQYVMNLKYKRDEIEQTIDDILTYIENTNYNAPQGYKVYKLLRDRQIHKKAVMEEIEMIEGLLENLNCEVLLKAYQSSVITMKSIKRKYEAPKEMKEVMELVV